MSRILIVILLIQLAAAPGGALEIVQDDWAAGPGAAGPVADPAGRFASAAGVAWAPVPGQLSLATTPLASAVKTTLGTGLDGAFGVATGDFDGDGDVDIVSVAEVEDTVIVWENDGATPPGFTQRVLDSTHQEVAAVVTVDLDGDGDLDIVTSSGNRYGRVTSYINGGGSPVAWTARDVDSSWGQAWEIATGDVDADGRIDVVGTSLSGGDVVWWRNDGADPIGWSRLVVDGSFAVPHSAQVGDLDGDGHPDIVACGTTSNTLAWWRSDGGDPITWTKTVISTVFLGGRSVRLVDLDGDGDLDIAGAGFGNRTQWWSNDGGDPVSWSTQVVDTGLSQPHQIQVGDLDGDGDVDLAVAAYGSNAICWYENGGGTLPMTWTRRGADFVLARPLALGLGDLDGDGALEILGTSNTSHELRWYDVTESVAAGALESSVLEAGSAMDAFAWNATVPPGTSLVCRVRSGDDPGDLGAWSAPMPTPGPLADGGRFLQYRLEFARTAAGVSPVVRSVSFTGGLASVLPSAPLLPVRVHPNPANPRAVVVVDLDRESLTRATVFDMRGRRVRVLAEETLAAGRHELPWDGTDMRGRAVSSGTYQVVVDTAGRFGTGRVTLVR